MSRIDEQARPANPQRPSITFIDGYQLQIDPNMNHRLVHFGTGDASIWMPEGGISVLHTKMVVLGFWEKVLPAFTLLEWQKIPTPPQR